MTPFNTALNVAGGMRQSSPKALMPKPIVKATPTPQMAILPKKKQAPQNAQVAAYGKAMQSAIRNTKSY